MGLGQFCFDHRKILKKQLKLEIHFFEVAEQLWGWGMCMRIYDIFFCHGLIKDLKKYSLLSKGAIHIFSDFLLLSGVT